MFRFEKLDVWQKALAFSKAIYALTSRFPSDERFGLTTQMRRASVSISSNIAEGSGRKSDTEFIRFLDIAYGSVLEVVSQLHLSRSLDFVNEAEFQATCSLAEELTCMLSGLRSSLEPGRRG